MSDFLAILGGAVAAVVALAALWVLFLYLHGPRQ